ncbi:MAG: protein translocase subunit SecD [Spirochaetaceae bacterium]|nr:protein translocase subunit SecD [Spirochaetaceae bacterium]MDT8298721.1 protein translocase subunit SecD [Spirochaetaceae bacterium]
MTKMMRLLLVLVFVGLGAVFLYPTVSWYFFTDQEMKTLANGTREEIRLWSEQKAFDALAEIEELSKDADAVSRPIPEEYDFLRGVAKENYRLADEDIPKDWTLGEVLNGFRNFDQVRLALEDTYRQRVLDLKEMKGKILALGLDLSGGLSVVLEPDFAALEEASTEVLSAEDKTAALESALEVINNRIDTFGVTEPQIRKQLDDSILIEIPGEADPERVNSFLMGRGSLGFYIVDDEGTEAIRAYTASGGRIEDGRPVEEGILAEGLQVLGYFTKDSYGIDQFNSWIVVSNTPGLDGQHIREARPETDQNTLQPIVTFRLDAEGATIFQRLTSENVQKYMAVVLDDKVKAYALITEAIPGGSVRVTGFDYSEANDLAVVLRTGSLPIELGIRTLQSVGASLGADTIQAGLNAILIGFGLVFVFMALWYKGAGLIADLALAINLFLLTALLSSFNFTLTMTSIAGLILTVGMSVDANVIIFERIKEELRMGKSRGAAVDTGFKKAFWTVMDAQITTLIAALFLSQLGKGPVQGFAVTLAWGIGCSLFTALFVSRLLFDIGTEGMKRQKLSIAWGIK